MKNALLLVRYIYDIVHRGFAASAQEVLISLSTNNSRKPGGDASHRACRKYLRKDVFHQPISFV
jgi:hypothetical protein